MGKTSSKEVQTFSIFTGEKTKVPCKPMKPIFLHKPSIKERRMIIYNVVPRNISKAKFTKKFCKLLKNNRNWIRSIKVESSLLQNTNSDLIRIISGMKNLKNMEIDYWGNNGLKKNNFELFSKALSGLKNLRSCVLKNHDPDVSSLKGSIYILKKLSRFNVLTNINLAFSDCLHNNGNEDLTKLLAIIISKLIKAKKLGLDFSTCDHFSEEVIAELATKFNRFRKVKELKVDLSCCPNIQELGLLLFIENLSSLNLDKLHLNLGGLRFLNDESFYKINLSLSKLTNLKEFKLELGGCNNFDSKGIQRLVQTLNKFEKLKVLKLDFSGCKSIMDYQLTLINQDATFYSRLSHLSIDFRNCGITDIGIIHLAQGFSKLTNLKTLSLAFGGFENLMSHALTCLSQTISTFNQLEKLKVLFVKTKVNDSGLQKFSQDISKLKQLKNLHLNFNLSLNITAAGLINLSEKIVLLTEMKDLLLDFSNCFSITSNGILTLTQSLHKMQKLSHVQLRFQHCTQLNKAAQDALKAFDN